MNYKDIDWNEELVVSTAINNIIDLKRKYFNLQQENAEFKKQIEIMEKYLELIVDLGFDFDGCNTVESLKGLVEELVHLASLARACNLTETIYENGGKKYNILHEEIENNE